MEKDVLQVERREGVATLVLNRPEKRNALSHELFLRIHREVQTLSRDGSIRALIIRGAGDRAFSSGFDIGHLQAGPPPDIQETGPDHDPMRLALESLISYPCPVIAMMNGVAFGAGYELAICCDLRVGADDIAVCMPPARIGVVYSHRGLRRFVRALGLSVTRQMFFTGDVYRGRALKEKGLVDYLVPRPELAAFTYELARKISRNAPLALAGTKKILNLLQETAFLSETDKKTAEEVITASLRSEDFREGQRAFLEKRLPRFQGK